MFPIVPITIYVIGEQCGCVLGMAISRIPGNFLFRFNIFVVILLSYLSCSRLVSYYSIVVGAVQSCQHVRSSFSTWLYPDVVTEGNADPESEALRDYLITGSRQTEGRNIITTTKTEPTKTATLWDAMTNSTIWRGIVPSNRRAPNSIPLSKGSTTTVLRLDTRRGHILYKRNADSRMSLRQVESLGS
jgi:hypothetical protein